jgi:hypothetical protein
MSSASSPSARCSAGWSGQCHSDAPSDSQQSPRLTAPAIGRPTQANPPLIVNADAVPASAVALPALQNGSQPMQQGPSKRRSRFHTIKLQECGLLQSRECLDPFPGGEFSGPLAPAADDHHPKYRKVRVTLSVKEQKNVERITRITWIKRNPGDQNHRDIITDLKAACARQ